MSAKIMHSKRSLRYDMSRYADEKQSKNGLKSMLRLVNQIKHCDDTDDSFSIKKKDTLIKVTSQSTKSRDLSATVRRVAYGFKLAKNLNELGLFSEKCQNNSMCFVKDLMFKTILDNINKYFAKHPDGIPRATEDSKKKLTTYLKDLLRMKTKPEVNSTHPSFKTMDALNMEILCVIKILAEKPCVSDSRRGGPDVLDNTMLQMALDNLEHTQIFLLKTYQHSRDISAQAEVQTALTLIRTRMDKLKQMRQTGELAKPMKAMYSVEGGNNDISKPKKKLKDDIMQSNDGEDKETSIIKAQKIAFIKIQKEINQLSLMKFQVRILKESLLEEVEDLRNELDHQRKINKALKELEKHEENSNKQVETKQLIGQVQEINELNKKLEAEVTLLESLLGSLTNNQDTSIRKINNIKFKMTTFLKERREFRKLVSQKRVWLESLVGADITQIVCLLRRIFKSLLSGNTEKQPLQEFVDILNRSFSISESAR